MSAGASNAATGFDPETEEPLYRITLGRPGTSHALRIAARLGLPPEVVSDATRHIAPERLRVTELLAEAEAAEEHAAEERARAATERAATEEARRTAEARTGELEAEIERVRASASAERERALADAEQELGGTRADLDALRAEIRAARRLERERRAASTPRALAKERERDRRLGAASERAARAGRSLRAADEPPEVTAPLAAGDTVVAPSLGVRGTIAEIVRDEAVVVGRGGLRVRVPLERLRPDRDGQSDTPIEPAVTIRAPAPTDARRARRTRAYRAGVPRGGPRVRRHRRARRARRAPRDPRPRHRGRPQRSPRRAHAPPPRLVPRVGLCGRGDRRAARLTVSRAANTGRNRPVRALVLVLLSAALARWQRHHRASTTSTSTIEGASGDAAAGKEVFASAGCGGCHTFSAAGSSGSVGPNLDDASPSFDKVVSQVMNGGGPMPSFNGDLTPQQIQDVAAFVSGS